MKRCAGVLQVELRDMLPPYDTEEVAEAVRRRLEYEGVVASGLAVGAYDVEQTWMIAATVEGGRRVVAHYPFAAPEGIHTPRELAEWFAREARRA